MSPACTANAALVTTGTTWAGGLVAFAIKKFRSKERLDRSEEKPKENS